MPHGHRLPQRGQHLVPVSDPHPTGLWTDDDVAQVLSPAVVRGLSHRHPQGEFLNTTQHGHTIWCVSMTLLHSMVHPRQFNKYMELQYLAV